MEKIENLFLQAVKAALQKEQVAWTQEISAEDWSALFRLAHIHNIVPMVLEAVYACPAIRSANPALLASVRQSARILVMNQASRTMEFLSLYRKTLAAGAAPLVVKGIICRELYPQPDHRASGDEDLLIPPHQYPLCKEVFTDFGMIVTDENAEAADSYEIPFGKKGSTIRIELHKSLFPPASDAYGDLNRFFTDVHGRAITVPVMGVDIRTMAPTDHLFYLICHAFKHFLHSGFGIRQICDIVLFANEYGSQIDWDLVFANCSAIRAERFAEALFQIGEQYLTFEPEKACCPASRLSDDVDCQPLLEDLMRAGVYGGSDESRLHSSNITLDAVSAQKQGKKAKGSLRASLFPSAKKLEDRYPYLKEKPWLLPAAWASRVITYSKQGQSSTNSAAESLKVGTQRVELLRKYGIIE